jgi:hypothetical protein
LFLLVAMSLSQIGHGGVHSVVAGFVTNRPTCETGEAMTDIRTASKDSRDPGTDTPPPGNTRRTARQLMRDLDGPGDDRFKESLADLSSQLGRRAAEQSTADPKAAAEARRAALQAYDLARERRLKTALRDRKSVV